MNFLRTLQKRCKTSEIKNEESSQLLILCVNCEEYIQNDLINKHALICTTTTKFIAQFDKTNNPLEENHFKLQKIKISLMEKQNNIIALRLSRIIELVQQITTVGKVELSCCQNYLNELLQLKSMPNSSLNLSLSIERIIVLIEEKKKILNKKLSIDVVYEKNQPLQLSSTKESQTQKHHESFRSIQVVKEDPNSEVISSNLSKCCVNQTSQQKIDVDQFKFQQVQQYQRKDTLLKSKSQRWMDIQQNQTFMPRQVAKKQLTQQPIQKQIIKSEILTNLSSNDAGALEELEASENSLYQRLFYSKLLKHKLQAPKNSVSQKISAKILWDEARKLRINQDKFDEFLKWAIDNPEPYLPNQF